MKQIRKRPPGWAAASARWSARRISGVRSVQRRGVVEVVAGAAWLRAWMKTRGAKSALALRQNSHKVGREPARAIPEVRCDPTFPRRDTTVLWSAAAPSHWRATSASPRDCRSPRSPPAWVARRPRSRRTCNAPRGALLYPRRSREGLGGGSLGLMAYRDPKGERDKRMPEKRRSSPGVRGGASRDPRDMAKVGMDRGPPPSDEMLVARSRRNPGILTRLTRRARSPFPAWR